MTIHNFTLQFLKDLANNNNREWFQENKSRFEAAQDNMKLFMKAVETELAKTDQLEESKLFRIYRDVRFSKDKSPYKTNFGIYFKRATKFRRGGYYLQIEPGNVFVGGGFWEPNPADLKRIRDEFAMDDKPIRQILSGTEFKKYFGELQGEELRTAPAGYDKHHPAIDLIRKKHFLLMRKFTDEQSTAPGFLQEVQMTFAAMRPFFDYMSVVLTTNLDGEVIV
jgi:uncharacterized protein (TIGR02453 family)